MSREMRNKEMNTENFASLIRMIESRIFIKIDRIEFDIIYQLLL
jgi:hypothetical protein